MATHNDLGKEGEEIAKIFLEKLGYDILDQNYVYKNAEVDIIALHKNELIFVEVKARSSTSFGFPESFVVPEKQKQMAKVANEYFEKINFEGEIRFDIVAIVLTRDGKHDVKHIIDAFFPRK